MAFRYCTTTKATKTSPTRAPRRRWTGPPPTKVEENIYIVQGKEKVKIYGDKVIAYGFKENMSQFWGKCFLCQCSGHSQRYCPLKYCQRCDDYGHSIVVCPQGDSNSKIVRQNQKGVRPPHPSVTSKNWREREARRDQSKRVREILLFFCAPLRKDETR